ncbi:DUF2975 domain-containing protein [Streptosporangium sp. NPDC023825]|uniref:DUF2975 domain-containing protein n=1 Tax=Streptosporangium sp. NPDC023825 TaxID=3154909 RepID=UPI003441C6DE
MEPPTSTPESEPAPLGTRRNFWLKWLYGALLLAVLAVALLSIRQLVVSVMLALGQGGTVPVSIPADSVDLGTSLPPGVELAGDHLRATVRVASGGLTAGLYHLLTWLPLAVVNLLSFWWMARLLAGGLRSDRSLFSVRTTRNLRLIGVTQLVGTLVIWLTAGMVQSTLSIHVLGTGAYYDELSPPAFTGAALIGLCALAVSEVVRKGRHMLEDLEGTV